MVAVTPPQYIMDWSKSIWSIKRWWQTQWNVPSHSFCCPWWVWIEDSSILLLSLNLPKTWSFGVFKRGFRYDHFEKRTTKTRTRTRKTTTTTQYLFFFLDNLLFLLLLLLSLFSYYLFFFKFFVFLLLYLFVGCSRRAYPNIPTRRSRSNCQRLNTSSTTWTAPNTSLLFMIK